jgi:protocatechuate 3,4-dioxygenase beta subunit
MTMTRRDALKYAGRTSLGATVLAPTPARGSLHLTDREIEGPFYTPDTPLRTVLRDADTIGTPLTIVGHVLATNGRPIAGAVLDVWSCDGRGVYDNDGFRLRGHQYTDATGAFRVETVKPGDYRMAGLHRTPHVHVKVQGRNTRLLTTQLYFPGEPLNGHDRIFDRDLVMSVRPAARGALAATFTFVLDTTA